MKKNILAILIWLVLVASAFADGSSGGGGGGGGAGDMVQSTYVVKSSDGGLSDENVATAGTGITLTYNTGVDPDTLTFLINQAFTPTWTGAHAFQAAINSTAAINMNAASYLTGVGTTEAQATCAAGSGCIFYEQSSDKWRVSQNGGSYADLVQASGVDLTAVNFITGAATALLSAESVLTDGAGIDTVVSGATATISLDTTAALSGDHTMLANAVKFGATGIIFEGPTADTAESYLTIVEPSASDKTWTLPNVTGTIVTTGDTGTVTGTMILDNTVTGTDIALASNVTGDIMRYNGTDWVRLGVGAEDDVLTVASGQPAWEASSCAAGGIEASTVTFMVAEATDEVDFEQVITDGEGIAWTSATGPDPDTITANVVADETTITSSDGVGNNEVAVIEAGVEAILDLSDLQGAVTDAQVPNTITINTAAAATALAANGANCSAGSYPLGVDASGAVEGCAVDATGSVNHGTTIDLFSELMGTVSTSAVDANMPNINVSGTGTQAVVSATLTDENHVGVVQCETGTTATGRCQIASNIAQLTTTGGALTISWLVRVEDLSTAADEYILRIGLCDNASGDCNDGVYFIYDRLGNATPGNWYGSVAGGGARTECDGDGDEGAGDTVDGTPVAVAADTWYKLTAEVNTAATSVVFKVATSGGADTTICTITGANIPVAGERFGPSAGIFQSANTAGADRLLYMDYMSMTKVVAR